jgi:hypothetical protein
MRLVGTVIGSERTSGSEQDTWTLTLPSCYSQLVCAMSAQSSTFILFVSRTSGYGFSLLGSSKAFRFNRLSTVRHVGEHVHDSSVIWPYSREAVGAWDIDGLGVVVDE